MDAEFWSLGWMASDASRAYRTRAAEWRADGFGDWADELDQAAEALDVAWDARIRAQHDA